MTRNVLVTGGSGGVGRAVARALTAAGCTVTIWGRDESRLDGVIATGDAKQRDVVDIGDPTSVADGVARLNTEAPNISVIVHCAGMWTPGSLAEIGVDALVNHVRTIVTGSLLVAKAAITLVGDRPGRFVQIAAASAKPGFVDTAVNTAGKRAQDGMHEGLTRELKNTKLRITTIYPNSIAAASSDSVRSGKAMSYDDVAAAVVFAVTAADTVSINEIVLTAPGTGRW